MSLKGKILLLFIAISVFESECGLTGRITGGNVARQGQFPYAVKLTIIRYMGNSTCTGSLISNEYVITAAHCLNEASAAEILFGSADSKEYNETQKLVVSSSSFNMHGGFWAQRASNDIALIKLPTPVNLTKYVNILKLPPQSEKENDFSSEMSTTIGYGMLDEDIPLDGLLRYAVNPVMKNEECRRKIFGNYLEPTQMCQQRLNNKTVSGACGGDSGGPLILSRPKQEPFLIGVTSTLGARDCCRCGGPAIYTRVTKYLDWIQQVTKIVV